MKPNLLIKDGKLLCAFVPDEPRFDYAPRHEWGVWQEAAYDAWEHTKAEAIANALPVINPTIAFDPLGASMSELNVGELYPWNGGAEKEKKAIVTDSGAAMYQMFVRLSLPDNKPKLHKSKIIDDLMSEITFEQQEATNQQMLKELNSEKKETQEQLWKESIEMIYDNPHQVRKLLKELLPDLLQKFTLTRRES